MHAVEIQCVSNNMGISQILFSNTSHSGGLSGVVSPRCLSVTPAGRSGNGICITLVQFVFGYEVTVVLSQVLGQVLYFVKEPVITLQ